MRIAAGGSAITIDLQTAYFLRPHTNGGGDCRQCVDSESNCGVCVLVLYKYPETSGGLFSRKTDAKWELYATLVHNGESMSIDTAETKESAVAKLAKYAADLGLHLFAPEIALRRDIIVAVYVSQSSYAPGNWCVTARTTMSGVNDTIVLHPCKSRDDAHAHMLLLSKQHFLASSSAATSETSQ